MHFSGKGRQSLHIYIYVMRIREMLISYVRLDHTLYLINYGTNKNNSYLTVIGVHLTMHLMHPNYCQITAICIAVVCIRMHA